MNYKIYLLAKNHPNLVSNLSSADYVAAGSNCDCRVSFCWFLYMHKITITIIATPTGIDRPNINPKPKSSSSTGGGGSSGYGSNPFAYIPAEVTGIPPTADPSNWVDKLLKASVGSSPSGTVTVPSTLTEPNTSDRMVKSFSFPTKFPPNILQMLSLNSMMLVMKVLKSAFKVICTPKFESEMHFIRFSVYPLRHEVH